MSRILSIGDSGPDVLEWKQYLAKRGFQIDTSNDKFTPSVLAATRAIQRQMGVTPDGMVGRRTLAAENAAPRQMPEARPGMPPAPLPRPGGLANTPMPGPMSANTPSTGDQPFVSSGTEADLNAMHSAASNRAWDQQMSAESVGRDTDMRAQQAAMLMNPAPPVTRDFTSDGASPTHALDAAIMAKRGIRPDFSGAGPSGGEPSMDFSGTGGALSPMGAPAPNDPRTRDMVIRMLLQGAGG
jgi:hypothetical protein